MEFQKMRDWLDAKVVQYNNPDFIKGDPVAVPHRFSKRQDIEIAGLFAAIFAWGNRTTIIAKTNELMHLLDNSPHQFICQHTPTDLQHLLHFRHRTFTTTDLLYFVAFLRQHYLAHESLESAFISPVMATQPVTTRTIKAALIHFHHYFFSLEEVPHRTKKHISTPERQSACKRLNMYMRWMVRRDNKGVDFGLWRELSPAQLICPLDLHVVRVATRLQLLDRKQTDWRAAEELTERLRTFDPEDPVKYDFALFSLGILEKF